MFAFIVGNTNFQMENLGVRNTIENNRVENLEVEIRNKIEKVKNFNPESCYNFSDLNDDFSFTGLSADSSQLSRSVNPQFNPQDTKMGSREARKDTTNPFLKTSNIAFNKTGKIIQDYKILIKWLDIIASILIILGCILSQLEHETNYYNNLHDRVESVHLISDIYYNTTKPLELYNISKLFDADFAKAINFTDYSSVPVIMEISEYCNRLRHVILFTSLVSIGLILISRYIEYRREFLYKLKSEIPFYKTSFLATAVIEILMVIPFQYPNLKTYYRSLQLGSFICLPLSSILSALSFLRFYFILKLFKHLTKWTSTKAEYTCERYVCKADTKFAFKAFQKENPFLILFIIFILTCVCFGLALRCFELYYWETKSPDSPGFQDWTYVINSFWCIFVSMTTVGYGDFYPKTHIGRFIAIIACLVGVYFVSMMMVFMTQKSILNENENKAYRLITRLKLRNEIKDEKADIVYRALLMALEKKRLREAKISEKDFHINYSYQKRKIANAMETCTEKLRMIKSFEFIPMKEHLFDISERIDSDIKEIKQELQSLNFLNETLINFSDSQIEVAKYLKKNCFAIKLLYNTIEKNPIFGKLNNVDFSLKDIFETEVERKDNKKALEQYERYNDNENLNEEDSIFNYINKREQIKEYFDFIFAKNQYNWRREQNTKACRTMNYIHKMKIMKMSKTSISWKRRPKTIHSTSNFSAVLNKPPKE